MSQLSPAQWTGEFFSGEASQVRGDMRLAMDAAVAAAGGLNDGLIESLKTLRASLESLVLDTRSLISARALVAGLPAFRRLRSLTLIQTATTSMCARNFDMLNANSLPSLTSLALDEPRIYDVSSLLASRRCSMRALPSKSSP